MKSKKPFTTRERAKLLREARALIKSICRCGHFDSEHYFRDSRATEFAHCSACDCQKYDGNVPFKVTLE